MTSRPRHAAHGPTLAALLACLALASAPPVAAAQQLAGTLRREVDSLPVAGALVVLGEPAGPDLARTVSTERGTFAFNVPSPGRYTLRVLRIGHRPFGPTPVDVPAGRAAVTLYVPDQPVVLAALTVASERSRCGIPSDSSVLGLLLAEARKAITLTQTTLDERRLLFMVETWQLRVSPRLQTLDSTATLALGRGWPIRSAPQESLRLHGFVDDEVDDAGRMSTVYYGPDATVLFADWFLQTHCLRIAPTSEPGLLAVDFSPARRGSLADIAGRFVYDSSSLALRELQFHWTRLPDWAPTRGPGGFVRFRRLDSGEWLPERWSLRAPVPEARGRVLRLREYLEVGGAVTSAQR